MQWHTVKFPTSDLIFQYTGEPLGECVYKEKSSYEWDMPHASYIRTQLKINPKSLENDTTWSEYIASNSLIIHAVNSQLMMTIWVRWMSLDTQ